MGGGYRALALVLAVALAGCGDATGGDARPRPGRYDLVGLPAIIRSTTRGDTTFATEIVQGKFDVQASGRYRVTFDTRDYRRVRFERQDLGTGTGEERGGIREVRLSGGTYTVRVWPDGDPPDDENSWSFR